jgi:undecaprenyl diphosphate synthase
MPPVKKSPHHIAIVMDGNGRWAQKRHLPRLAGHKRGVDALKTVIQACIGCGIPILTVFAFSSENWSRPTGEVSGLLELLNVALRRELVALHARGIRVRFLGSRQGLEADLCAVLDDAEQATQANQGMILNVCFNYGGRWDIVDAAARLAAAGTPITEASMSAALSLAPCPDPDLLIRTGDEYRLSNFLLWQCAYSELYFSPVLWPDFDAAELDLALGAYASRERRFGRTRPAPAVVPA